MNSRILKSAVVGATVMAASVAVAATIPGASAARPDTRVLARRVAASTSATTTTVPQTVMPASTTTSSTEPPSTTTTTAPAPPALRPGPLAAPTPAAPVTLTESTPALERVPTTDRVIFLGIDDGLVRDPALLTLLRKERIPLTLFLVHEPAADGQAFFREMQTLGATVQAHTLMHPHLRNLGWSDQHHEICDELDDLTTWYGARPTLFRPPYGEWNETTRNVVSSCGLRALVLWRGATNDGRLDIVGGDLHPGDILLMHFRTDLVENLQLVLAKARAEGFRIGRLEDYLGTGPAHPMFDR